MLRRYNTHGGGGKESHANTSSTRQGSKTQQLAARQRALSSSLFTLEQSWWIHDVAASLGSHPSEPSRPLFHQCSRFERKGQYTANTLTLTCSWQWSALCGAERNLFIVSVKINHILALYNILFLPLFSGAAAVMTHVLYLFHLSRHLMKVLLILL